MLDPVAYAKRYPKKVQEWKTEYLSKCINMALTQKLKAPYYSYNDYEKKGYILYPHAVYQVNGYTLARDIFKVPLTVHPKNNNSYFLKDDLDKALKGLKGTKLKDTSKPVPVKGQDLKTLIHIYNNQDQYHFERSGSLIMVLPIGSHEEYKISQYKTNLLGALVPRWDYSEMERLFKIHLKPLYKEEVSKGIKGLRRDIQGYTNINEDGDGFKYNPIPLGALDKVPQYLKEIKALKKYLEDTERSFEELNAAINSNGGPEQFKETLIKNLHLMVLEKAPLVMNDETHDYHEICVEALKIGNKL